MAECGAWAHANLREVRRVAQGGEDTSETENWPEIDRARQSVLKAKIQTIVAKRFCVNNVP